MAGGSLPTDANPTAATQNAQASGSAGTAGADMPLWQKGLMGAVTGDPRYGKNAPAVSALLQKGLGLMSRPQPQSPGPLAGPPPSGMAPSPGMPQRPMGPGMGMPPQQGMPQQMPQQNPWMR